MPSLIYVNNSEAYFRGIRSQK